MKTCEKIWDANLISDLFEDKYTNIILSIPLGVEDKDGINVVKRWVITLSKALILTFHEAKTQSHNEDNSCFLEKNVGLENTA